MKRRAILAAKLAVAALLIAWLIRAGKLDFGALELFADRPALIAVDLIVLGIVAVLGGVRWRLLLRLAGVQLSLGRALQLHFTGLFFNVVIAGGIGGDVVKAVYVAREVEPSRRVAVYLIGFVDRLIGVAGLVVVAAGTMLLRGPAIWEVPELGQLAIAIAIVAAVTIASPLVVLVLLRRRPAGAERPGLLGRLVAAARLVAGSPRAVAAAVGLAVAIHVLGISLFAILGAALAPDASVANIATVYPLGMLTLVVPISYAGFGVGHVAFERLFEMLGMTGGATAFNIYLIGQTAPCLLGVLPYLTLRRTAGTPTAAEADALDA